MTISVHTPATSATIPNASTNASISNQFLKLEWSHKGLTLSENKFHKIIFHRANSRVFLYDGQAQSLFDSFEIAIDDDGSEVTFCSKSNVLGIKLRCSLEARNFSASLYVTNLGLDPIRLGDVQILTFDRQEGALSHLLTDPCDVFSLGVSTGETEEVWSKVPGNKKVFAMRLSQTEPAYNSDNIIAARPVDAGRLTPHAIFSFDRIAEVASGVSINLTQGLSTLRAAFRGTTLAPGSSRALPTLYIDALSAIHESLAAASERIAAIYHPAIKDTVPAGWCSWYYYYPHVTEAHILENLNFLARNRDRFPYSYIQIDDGYQLHWGDWLLPGSKFPHDMAWLGKHIKDAGFKPGIWVAPLIATKPSFLFREHPEWALRDLETGEPWTLHGWSSPEENPWVIQDATHPEFREHLKHIFHTMAHVWGYDYFKLDATAFAAYPGLRHDPTKTGIESVRMALEAIREAIGPDKYILGCGVPFGAAIGLVNGERVSDDISTAFCAEQFVCPIEISMPQTIHRSFINGKWWHNDPDCVLVRSQGTPHELSLSKSGLSLDEARFFTTVVGLTRGIQMVGERMEVLSEERLRLLDIIQPLLDAPAVPQDLFASHPSRLLLQAPHGIVLGLLNWQHTAHTMTVNWSDLGLADNNPHNVYELWTRSCLVLNHRSRLDVEVPAHGARVLLFRSAVAHPSFLGFDGHISCGATLLRHENWDAKSRLLKVDFIANCSGTAKFHAPRGWIPHNVEFIPREPGCWDVHLEKGDHGLNLEFIKC